MHTPYIIAPLTHHFGGLDDLAFSLLLSALIIHLHSYCPFLSARSRRSAICLLICLAILPPTTSITARLRPILVPSIPRWQENSVA
jgi:hypothetical protein